MSDTLWLNCHICTARIATKRVEDNQTLPPSTVIRWHERAIAHVRKVHQKREAPDGN